jgi:hypothetical protein
MAAKLLFARAHTHSSSGYGKNRATTRQVFPRTSSQSRPRGPGGCLLRLALKGVVSACVRVGSTFLKPESENYWPLLTPTMRVGNAGYGTGPAFRRAEISSDGGVELGFEPSGMGCPGDGSLIEDLKGWVDQVLKNSARTIQADLPTEWVVVTDASASGWGALALHVPSGSVKCLRHEWEKEFERRFHSTAAEPEADNSLLLHRESKRGHAGEDFLRLDDGGAGTTERIKSGILREHGCKPPAQGFPVVATRGGTCAW